MHYNETNDGTQIPVAAIYQPGVSLCRRDSAVRDPVAPSLAYRLKLGREPIWLSPIEFRILTFLAARPYRAYSRRKIVQAVSSDRFPLLEESLDRYIDSLRDKLGFFRDTIQSVPYIGYRFKA